MAAASQETLSHWFSSASDSFFSAAFSNTTTTTTNHPFQIPIQIPILIPSSEEAAASSVTDTMTPRNQSSSDPETTVSKRTKALGPIGKKRKSRASKKNPTTFITADPANFRQMVQQVTGVKFPTGSVQGAATMIGNILKPEPQRAAGGGYSQLQGCRLPTLDTSSALLLNEDHHHHHRHHHNYHEDVKIGAEMGGVGFAAAAPSSIAVAEDGDDIGQFDDQFNHGFVIGGGGFPTLESWKVM